MVDATSRPRCRVGMASETGEQVEVNAQTLTDAQGRVRIAQETYTDQDGKEQVTNRIGTWLSPEA